MEDQSSEKNKTNKSRFSRADITAFIALIISLGALFVSVLEANIMKKQQEIMQTQQKATVYPYLTQKVKIEVGEKISQIYSIENKGVGPAKIKNTVLYLNDKPLNNINELQTEVNKVFPEEIKSKIVFNNPEHYFISPKEKITIFKITLESADNQLAILQNLILDIKFDYCSIFNECWSSSDNNENVFTQ